MVETISKQEHETRYLLKGLACYNCATKIEEAVNDLPYVKKAELNFGSGIIIVKEDSDEMHTMEASLQNIADNIEPGVTVQAVNNSIAIDMKGKDQEDIQRDGQNFTTGEDNKYFKRQFFPGVVLFILAILLFEIPIIKRVFIDLPVYLEWIFFGFSYLLIGGPVLRIAFMNIKRGKVFDENFLMTVATLGAFAIHEFPEAVAVMLFYMVGEIFQNKAVDRSRRSIKKLMDIRPDFANLKQENKIIKVNPESVKTGDIIIIKPGEKVPVDGQVLKGSSMVDTSALTGESVPNKVESGDEILSGMVNQDGLLTVKVKREYAQSTVSRILDLVENASAKKAPTEKFITRFARYYTPVVVYTALAIAFLPPLFIPEAIFIDWVYRALIFLVISCPCALVVSIPLGFFGGIGRASRQGILVKGGNYLEALNNVSQIVFDKTGTLTRGEFAVNRIETKSEYSQEEILKKAAQAESYSTHPIAKSILKAYNQEIEKSKVKEYQEISGHGIKAIIDGEEVLVGNEKLMNIKGVNFHKANEPGTIVYIAINNKYAGYITIFDEMKKDSIEAVKKLKELGIKLTMLTGDREDVARRIANDLGLNNYFAELLPDQKVMKVEELLAKKGDKEKLVFVGDGINDAPVLARSDIGVAMGGLGSDAAIEAADIVLMTDEPSKLVTAINTARKTKQIVWQNIIMAFCIKGVILVMGTVGLATMWGAVFADVGVALLAVLNALRIK